MWKTVLRFDVQWEPGQFSSPMRISKQVLVVVLTGWFSLRNRTETQRQFSADEWEPPNTGQKNRSNSVCHKKWCISEYDPPLKANVLFYRFFKNLTRFWTKLRVLVPCFLDFTKNSIMFNICENSSFLSF